MFRFRQIPFMKANGIEEYTLIGIEKNHTFKDFIELAIYDKNQSGCIMVMDQRGKRVCRTLPYANGHIKNSDDILEPLYPMKLIDVKMFADERNSYFDYVCSINTTRRKKND